MALSARVAWDVLARNGRRILKSRYSDIAIEDREDLLQESLEVVWVMIRREDQLRHPSAVLRVVLQKVIANWRRKNMRRRHLCCPRDADLGELPVRMEMPELIREDELPAHLRRLYRRLVEGHSLRGAAVLCEVALTTAHRMLHELRGSVARRVELESGIADVFPEQIGTPAAPRDTVLV